MKVLICPDKFKFTFSSVEIASIIEQIVSSAFCFDTKTVPLSDGGEGFLSVIASALDIQFSYTKTYDPLGREIIAKYLFDREQKTAYLELAQTGALNLLKPEERNPMNTSTYGLGVQIKNVLELGAKKIHIGLGGSSTTDMGMGMAAALGYVFWDKNGNKLEPVGRNMIHVTRISEPEDNLRSKAGVFACVDVSNVLFGENGAAYVYSPQKGASSDEVEILDMGLRNLSEIIYRQWGMDVSSIPGAGAAGGLGAGVVAFLNGKIIPGADFIFSLTGLEEQIRDADIIITGEGKFDRQTLSGKLVWKVVQLAAKYDKPVLIVAGIGSNYDLPSNVDLISLFDTRVDMETAKRETEQRLKHKLVKYLAEKYPDACM